MNFKKATLVMASAMMAVSLTACGSSSSEASATASGESSGTLTVEFWTAPQQVQYDFWEAKAEAFNETGTQVNGKTIEVKVQMTPESPSSEAGIQNAIATGTAPAVSENINRGFAATLAASDAVYDLSGEDWFNEVIDARAMGDVMTGWEIDGGQYVLPVYVNPMTWQWNVAGLKVFGYTEAPTTIAELQDIMSQWNDKKDELEAVGITHSFYRPSLTRSDQYWDRWYDFMMPYYAISQGKSIVEGSELTMDEESGIKAMEVIGTFGNTIQQSELSSIWTEDQPSVLVTISAPWEISLYKENNKVYGEDYVYGPALVENEGDTPYCFADSKGLTFYKTDNISDDEHEGAVEFVKWVYNADNAAQTDLEWLNATTMLPVRGDLNENETFTSVMSESPELSALAEWVPYAIPGLASDKDADIWTAFTESAMAPYVNEVVNSEPGNAPDATTYLEAGMEAMKTAGELS
jgi:multiple sugar transport system substrate-binding protein